MLAFNDKVNTIGWEDQSSCKGTALCTVPTGFVPPGQSSTPSASPDCSKTQLDEAPPHSQLSYEPHSLLPSTINHPKEQNQSSPTNSNKNLLHSVSNSRRCYIRRCEAILSVTHLLTTHSSSTVSLEGLVEGRASLLGPRYHPHLPGGWQVALLWFVFNSQGLHIVPRWKPLYILLYWVCWLI